ncbi:MAG: hypothetical protein ACRDEB_07385, partial [Chitinophagaceae bacterium]
INGGNLIAMQPSNILKIESLSDGWCDKDHVLLHACFQLLSDFVEKEMLPMDKHLDWKADNDCKKARKSIEELYAWWQEFKKTVDEKSYTFKEDIDNYQHENEMLKKLIDVRMYMWT